MSFIPLPLVIVAGGKSSRMGSDKALLPFGGYKTLTQYQLQRLKPFFKSIHISAKSPEKFGFEASFINDNASFSDHSPLVALLSILEHFNSPVCILSVDTPFVTPEVYARLYEFFLQGNDAIIASSSSSSHQLCAIYTPAAIEHIYTLLKENKHKIRLLLDNLKTAYVNFEEDEIFANLNHPEDYESALDKL